MPSVIRWNRIEPYARSIGLEGGLRAEIRDPLWMLARQWQFGEFWGEDAGSPIQARLRMDCTPLTRYLPGGIPASWYPAAGTTPTTVAVGETINVKVPLETAVEREPVREDEAFKPRFAAEAGQHFLRLLADAGGRSLRAGVIATVPLVAPSSTAALDADTQRFMSVMAQRVPDGTLLASVLRIVTGSVALTAFVDPYKTRVGERLLQWQAWVANLGVADRDRVTTATNKFLTWYGEIFSEPATPASSSWMADRLEYELALAAPTPQQEVLLTAPEYTDGQFDWYSFDTLAKGSLGAVREDLSPTDVAREKVRCTTLPTPIRYPGMPSSRYWEFEDARVDFGAIATGAQQLAHLVLIEFALVSGDDWSVIPVDMPVGSLATMRWLVVTDTFGERTLIQSARRVDGGTTAGPLPWDLFRLSPDLRPVAGAARTVPDAFLLPPSLGASLRGTAIEEVLLLRDEMANMAWAVERIVESPLGQPLDRAQAHYQAQLPPADATDRAPAPDPPAPLIYKLATDVPGHWLPLYPTRLRADAPPIALLRGGAPQGRILDPARTPTQNPLLIREEEVPRAGARVTRAYQYARWIDGTTHLWVGRRKTVGRGEGSSGLRFDVLEPPRRPV